MGENNINEVISCYRNPAEVIDHICDDNGNNLFNTEEEADSKSIHSINVNNDTNIKDDDNFIHKYYAQF